LIANSPEDVIGAIGLPDSELRTVAARARERTFAEHTGEQRALELVSALEQTSSRSPDQRARSEVA
jgi:hypothetical protein